MFRALLTSFIFSFTLLLAACGSEGTSTAAGGSSPSASSSSSVAAKGILKGVAIQVQQWNGTTYDTVETANTNDEGRFTLNLADRQPGDVYRLRLANEAGNSVTMVCDAAQCGAAEFGEDFSFDGELELTSWATVDGDGELTIMPVTPVSTMLVAYAEFLGNGRLTTANIAVARSHVAALFRMSPADVMAVPGNIASTPMIASMTEASRKISLLSAAFAELSGGDAGQMGADIQRFSAAFVANNGTLMESDSSGTMETLHDIYVGASSAASLITSAEVQGLALDWAQGILAVLRNGELSSLCRHPGGDCSNVALDSSRFVDALGAMGNDVRDVLADHGYNSIEAALAAEFSKFGWLLSADTFALAGAAVQTAGYGVTAFANNVVTGMVQDMVTAQGGGAILPIQLFPLEAINGLTPQLIDANTLAVTGEQNGLQVNLLITVPLGWTAMKGDKKFPINVAGTLSNTRIKADVDATVTIDATGTNFNPLMSKLSAVALAVMMQNASENQIMQIVAEAANLASTAKFNVDVDLRKARVVKLDDGSQLSMEGSGWVNVDMKGGNYGLDASSKKNNRIVLNGAVIGGQITLPNGSWFAVNEGEKLTFEMAKDGSFDADISASVLTLFKAKGQGTLKNLGVLASDLRDDIVATIQTVTTTGNLSDIGLADILGRLLSNVTSMDLLVEGDVLLVEKIISIKPAWPTRYSPSANLISH